MIREKTCVVCGKQFEAEKQAVTKCEECRQPVFRKMNVCPNCWSTSIHRRHLVFKKVKSPDKPTKCVRIPRYACYACKTEFETPIMREIATYRLPCRIVRKKKEAQQASN